MGQYLCSFPSGRWLISGLHRLGSMFEMSSIFSSYFLFLASPKIVQENAVSMATVIQMNSVSVMQDGLVPVVIFRPV